MRRVFRWVIGGRTGLVALALVAVAALLIRVPAALAFPYRAQLGATVVLSEQPLDPAIGRVLTRADRLLARSPIDEPGLARQVVLTDGGWRWQVLALGQTGAMGLRRPFSNALIFNRSDLSRDRVTNGRRVGGARRLSGAIAHETTHLLVARRIGEIAMARLPF